jgi:tRNA(fMet)-specific endonuclease VapC
MTLYILDTDHLSLLARRFPALIARTKRNNQPVTTTAVNVEEQLRGRLAQVAEAKTGETLTLAYQLLIETVWFLDTFDVLHYTAEADEVYQQLKRQRIRVGTQDLRIASITIANRGTLLTRNLRDFEKIPDLRVEDWST